ncbi:MAG: glycosyltransferase family 2 protein [Candidatus Diapherotrites archaeon]
MLTIVVPCHNEEQNLEECIRRVPQMPWETEIIVVDDGSTDRTAHVCRGVAGEERRKGRAVRLVSYGKSRGKGFALRRGLESANGGVVAILDADMQNPPEELPHIVEPIMNGSADFVNTNRFAGGGHGFNFHSARNRLLAFFFAGITGINVRDCLSGMKIFRAEPLKGRLKEDGWPDFELLVLAKRRGMRIVELPVAYEPRESGKSKMLTLRGSAGLFRAFAASLLRR